MTTNEIAKHISEGFTIVDATTDNHGFVTYRMKHKDNAGIIKTHVFAVYFPLGNENQAKMYAIYKNDELQHTYYEIAENVYVTTKSELKHIYNMPCSTVFELFGKDTVLTLLNIKY